MRSNVHARNGKEGCCVSICLVVRWKELTLVELILIKNELEVK